MLARAVSAIARLGFLFASAATLMSPTVALADEAGIELYEKKLRPALIEHCQKCHGPEKQEGGLQLDSVAAMLRGGDQGPAVVPGDPDASLLIQGIRYDDVNFQMPPKGKLPTGVVAAFEEWVRRGAPAPATELKSPGAAAVKKFDLAERAKHWCFQPLRETAPPEVRDPSWPRGAVDRFLLHKLEQTGLKPAPPAEPHEIIRRLSFDLIGLPPTPVETESFVAAYGCATSDAAREAAYAALVDRLLASPHFGERWARHWLDLVRFAETRGHEFDYAIPNAWQYRDYVVRAFNADVPYDQFVVEHLAGDLLPEPRRHPHTGGNESILGTGFWFLGEECHSPVDIRQDETDRVDNKIDVMSKTFLGLTLACARCHDHKFDALSTKDYYAMSGFVLGMSYRQAAFETAEHNKRLAEQIAALDREYEPAVRQAQLELWRPVLARLDRYLLAARDVQYALRRAKDDSAAEKRAALAGTAKQHDIDPARLAAWYDYLSSPSARDEGVSMWADFAQEAKLPSQRMLEGFPGRAAGPWPRVVVNYGRAASQEWLEDGVVFGGGPQRVGRLHLGRDPIRPILRVETEHAAIAEPRWCAIAETEPSESPSGRLNWRQSARTLKTPTFTLTTGKLQYFVRGSAHVYASVSSHRMNNGPLHGGLIKLLPGDDEHYRWVEHDLSAYRGQRVHLEFTPYEPDELKEKQSAELAIAGVIECEDTPNPLPLYDYFGTDDRLVDIREWIDRLDVETLAKQMPEQQARTLASFMKIAFNEFAEREFAGGPSGRRVGAAIVDWMLRRPELFATALPADSEPAKQLAEYFRRREALWAQAKPAGPTAPAAWEGSAVDEYVLIRGNHRTVGDLVPRRFLEAIDSETPPEYRTAGGRLALAERLVDRSDPLPARVMVNRLWQHLFGQGLVRTVDNFGSMGELPTHPELLDYLAQEFMSDGWSVKRMLRRVALSQAYRMSSRRLAAPVAGAADPMIVDPENKLLHRANQKRLEGEIVRDAMLAVSGRLDRRLFGPSVEVYLTPFMDGRGKPQSGPLDGSGRRSIYLKVRRNFLNPMFQAFDYPTPFTSVGRRSTSNVPQQSLALMNGELPMLLAEHWAKRLPATEAPPSDDAAAGIGNAQTPATASQSRAERIARLYLEAFARRPTPDEVAAGLEFVADQKKLYGATNPEGAATVDERVWADYCHVLLNTKEFIFIP